MLTIRNLMFAALMATTVGCTGQADVQYSGGGTAYASTDTPDLVEVSPGVQVIADYDEPVFYSDNYYWRYNSGVWYQSSSWGGGWVSVSTPPVVIARIDRPTAYVHYRPAGWHPRERTAVRREPVRREPVVRREPEHREPVVERREPVVEHREVEHRDVERQPQPTVVEHREPTRNDVREQPRANEPARQPAPARANNDAAAKEAARKAAEKAHR